MKMRSRRVKISRHPLRMEFHRAASFWRRALGVPIRAAWGPPYDTFMYPAVLSAVYDLVGPVPSYTPEEAEWVESLHRRINEAMTARTAYLTSFYPLREGES